MTIKIIGAGLAGVEAAYQLLKREQDVILYEMRPIKYTPQHNTGDFAELICSNSLKSNLLDSSSGLLKEEMRGIGSIVLEAAEYSALNAGSALAVDKKLFSYYIEKKLRVFPNLRIIREEVTNIDITEPTVIASGPLTSDALADQIKRITGNDNLHFFDAVAPIIDYDSINMDKAFFASRFNKGTDDYINCPMTRGQYDRFYNELVMAKCVRAKEWEQQKVFEACLPIETMAKRGIDCLRFGPLKPIGIRNPDTKENYYAVVQLRKENKSGTMYNMVGFQTSLSFDEQRRVFRLITGLEKAEFLRYGVMHRNTFINSPKLLDSSFRLKDTEVYFAGQITGVEGYVESAMSGMLAAINIYRRLKGYNEIIPSEYSLMGALSRYISSENTNFQPMNANFGLLPLVELKDKSLKRSEFVKRSLDSLKGYYKEVNV